jgi:transposase-like protein
MKSARWHRNEPQVRPSALARSRFLARPHAYGLPHPQPAILHLRNPPITVMAGSDKGAGAMPKSVLDKPFFQNETAAYAKLESIIWPNGPVCIHCGDRARIGLMRGKATRPGLYKCYACRKQFRVTVGTVFEASHLPLHMWLQAVYIMVNSKKAISTHQMQRAMGCTLKSAWFMTMRIRKAMKPTDTDELGSYGATVYGLF